MARRRRSISFPILLGVLTIALCVGLLVGWILLIVQNFSLTDEVAQNSWLLALGSLSFVLIITALVLFSVFLAREIRTVNLQTRFLDSVTHELKSPLASLKLCLGTLGRDDLAPAQRTEVRQMMIDDVERLSIFIDDVLEASRLSHPWEGHSVEHVPLARLIRRCTDGLLRYYKQPATAIVVRVEPDLELETDPAALEIVLKNLLDNALKYSLGLAEPPLVTVDAVVEQHELRLEIHDRGVGIPKRCQKRVFDRFYRVPHETVRARKGTGLGLFVASAIVRVLGGRIRVLSDGVGHGTTARVWLPIASRTKRRAQARSNRVEASHP